MYVQGRPSPVVIVTDWRTRSDAELDVSQGGEHHVLSQWELGRQALGQAYRHTTRIALFDYDTTPSETQIANARTAWLDYLETHKPDRVIVLPTPSASMGEGASAIGQTVCWQALKAPDSLDALRLCLWERGASNIMPLYPVARRTKQLQLWANACAMRRATRDDVLLPPTPPAIYPGPYALEALKGMALHKRPIAIDPEFVPSLDLVTAINLSDGDLLVSMPYHAYWPTGGEHKEPALVDHPDGAEILELMRGLIGSDTDKYCHNFVADVPLLQTLGFEVGGKVHDTFAAHAVALPELRHGLQAAAATLLPIPPWKSLYKPRDPRGITRDDVEYWTSGPELLRDYGAKDAFYTWHLAQAVLPIIGVRACQG